jgi:YfaZ precursor
MQNISKFITILLIFFILTTASQAIAKSIRLEMYANSDDIILGVESETLVSEAILNIGVGAIFSGEDYRIGNAHFSLKDEVFVPALTLGLGLKGVVGMAEDEDNEDYDLAALGFTLLGEYDFRKVYYNLPIVVQADVTHAPDPMTSADTQGYTEFNLRLKGYLVKSAALVLGYKNIAVDFEKDSDDYELTDDIIYFGIEFRF